MLNCFYRFAQACTGDLAIHPHGYQLLICLSEVFYVFHGRLQRPLRLSDLFRCAKVWIGRGPYRFLIALAGIGWSYERMPIGDETRESSTSDEKPNLMGGEAGGQPTSSGSRSPDELLETLYADLREMAAGKMAREHAAQTLQP